MDSRDILFITLAICAAVLTGMTAWFLTYVIRILRNLSGVVEDFRDRLRTIDEILHTIQDKISSTHLQLSVLATGLKELIGFFASRRAKRRSNTRASSSADDI